MRDKLYKKTLVFGILVLFIGSSVVSITSGEVEASAWSGPPNLPDLQIDYIILNEDNYLIVAISNQGEAEVQGYAGQLSVFVDYVLVEEFNLSDLADQTFRQIKRQTIIQTGVRLNGTQRCILAFVDSQHEVQEMDEFQNTMSVALDAVPIIGYDLVITAEVNSQDRLLLSIVNDGEEASPSDLPIDCHIYIDDQLNLSFPEILPALEVGPLADPHILYTGIVVSEPTKIKVICQVASASEELDNSNNIFEATLYYVTIDDINIIYDPLLSDPLIKNSMYWETVSPYVDYNGYDEWPTEMKEQLKNFLLLLEQGKPFPIEGPPPLLNISGNDYSYISPEDAREIYIAHVAQCLWYELHDSDAWNITDLSSDELVYLFDGRKLIRIFYSYDVYYFSANEMGAVTPWDPSLIFNFMDHLGMIKSTQEETVFSLVDWFRAHVRHVSGVEQAIENRIENFGYKGIIPVERIPFPLAGMDHVSWGCGGTSGFFAAALRTINIPVIHGRTCLANPGEGCQCHSRIELPTVRKNATEDLGIAVVHSDDFYSGYLKPWGNGTVPSPELFYTFDEINTLIDDPQDIDFPNTPCQQATQNHYRHWSLIAREYLPGYYLQKCGESNESLDDILRGSYALPYLNESERLDFREAARTEITNLGDGNFSNGVEYLGRLYWLFCMRMRPDTTPPIYNKPPRFLHGLNRYVETSDTVILSLTATAQDPDGDQINYTALNLPDGSTFQDNVFEWNVGNNVGPHEIIFQAKDNIPFTGGVTQLNVVIMVVGFPKIIADTHGPYEGVINESIEFTGSAIGFFQPYTWHWNFSDGPNSTEQNPVHIYNENGTYTVTLTVTDNNGYSDNDTVIVPVKDLDVHAGGPYYGVIYDPVEFNGSVKGAFTPYTWYWDFGDGYNSTEEKPVHTYNDTNTYTVTFSVTDSKGNIDCNTTTAIITENINWIYFHNGVFNSFSYGSTNILEAAIRITPEELMYEKNNLTAAKFFLVDPGTHSGHLRIYDEGSSTAPGALLASEPFTVSGRGWREIILPTPIVLNISKDIWVSFVIEFEAGENTIGFDNGPAVAGKGDWVNSSIIGWYERRDTGVEAYDANWCIEALVSHEGPQIEVPFYLNLNDFPMYEAEDIVGYTLEQMCGPAVAQMNIDYMWWNSSQNPGGAPTWCNNNGWNQSNLFNYGHDNNSNTSLSHIDATGLLHTINTLDPPYDPYGYNFGIRHNTNSTELLKSICYWIDYDAGQVPGYPLHVPGAVPAYGDYSNWMSIRGIHTSEKPDVYPYNNLTVYGFWVNDPLPSGIGENTYKTADEWLNTYHWKINVEDDPYYNESVAIVEPPIGVNTDNFDGNPLILPRSPSRFTLEEGQETPDALDAVQAAIASVTEQLIPYDSEFAEVFKTAIPGEPLLVKNLIVGEKNGENEDYIIVPFINSNGGTVVVVRIDAEDGHFLEVSWVKQPVDYLSLSDEAAIEIALEEHQSNVGEPTGEPVVNGLVHTGGTPYLPSTEVNIDDETYYVDPYGNLQTYVPYVEPVIVEDDDDDDDWPIKRFKPMLE